MKRVEFLRTIILHPVVKKYNLFDLPDTFGNHIENHGVFRPFFVPCLLFLGALKANHAVNETKHRTQADQGNNRHGNIVKGYHLAITAFT
jgi:hypothetical protein